jgi:demethylmenaquinone methyltransferase/2-methoxy-6-polyprenyl-1,4-benzoquinol methylase
MAQKQQSDQHKAGEGRTTHAEPGDDGRNRGTTHFGFRSVATEAKAPLVHAVFSRVASRYDLMNDLMSGGVHRLWKAAMVDWLAPRPDWVTLDIGGGTGDIAFRIRARGGGPVSVADTNEEMLRIGRDRAIERGFIEDIGWICGDAERLPVADCSVDAVTIAFCIRNVTHIDQTLREIRRVLKPGGRFLCLEFSRVVLPVIDRLYDAYSFRVLPTLGRLVARDADAYRYLAESIRRFPSQETFARMIRHAGLDLVHYRNLSGGIAALHSAWRT